MDEERMLKYIDHVTIKNKVRDHINSFLRIELTTL